MNRNGFVRLALLLLLGIVVAVTCGCRDASVSATPAQARLAGPRLLVIAPHPDDETLATGGAIDMAVRDGWKVTVVFFTSGDGFWSAVRKPGAPFPSGETMQAFGAKRVAETRGALSALGVPESDVIFLGFPDGSTNRLWTTNWDATNIWTGTNGASHVPYAYALKPGAPYAGAEALSELESVVRAASPTTVLYPDAADANRDHWAVSAFTQSALLATGFRGRAFTYIVHRKGFPQPLGLEPRATIVAPSWLDGIGTAWTTLPLPATSVATKQRALDAYKTQLASDRRLVTSFIRANEMYGESIVPTLGDTPVRLAENGAEQPKYATPPGAKVREIDLARHGSDVVLGVRTRAALSPDVTYTLRARALGPSGFRALYDVAVTGGQATSLKLSQLDVDGSQSLRRASGDEIDVALPPGFVAGAEWLLVSVDTSASAKPLDHAPWRAVRLAP